MLTKGAQLLKEIEERLPVYHTRQMRKDFARRFDTLNVTIPKHVIRSVYSELPLDASADQNPSIDDRVRLALLHNDPELILDLRHLNQVRPADTFSVFFDTLTKQIEDLTAADERRHGIAHLSYFISVRDLIEQVKKDCPDGTPIPSKSTVLFAFVPQNAYSATAKLYKSKVNLKFKIQSRQLRASHIDEHFCAAQFKYIRHYAVKYRDVTTFLSIDDKPKLDFGEPGLAISSGVRGEKSIVPMNHVLGALDHDVNSKGSFTPSVYLNVDIPEEENDSFYAGQVKVVIKDAVFQSSNAFRHAAEMKTVLQDIQDTDMKPVLILFSDGGPDHRLTYESVKLSLISITITITV